MRGRERPPRVFLRQKQYGLSYRAILASAGGVFFNRGPNSNHDPIQAPLALCVTNVPDFLLTMPSFVTLLGAALAVTLLSSLFCDSFYISLVTLVLLACKEFLKHCVICAILTFDAILSLLAVYLVLSSALARRFIWILLKLLIGCLYIGFRLLIFTTRSILVPIARKVFPHSVSLFSALPTAAFTLPKRILLALVLTVSDTAVHYLLLTNDPVSAHCLASALTGITERADKIEVPMDDQSEEMGLGPPSPTSPSSSLEGSDMDISKDFDLSNSSATSLSAPLTPASSTGKLDVEADLWDAEEEFVDAHEDLPEAEYRFVDDDVEMHSVEPENTMVDSTGSSDPSISVSSSTEGPIEEKRRGKAWPRSHSSRSPWLHSPLPSSPLAPLSLPNLQPSD
ncbi:hypothetical protein FRC06_007353 [Ceratobasidium sp. 370]|nr:hypothetical protein FRC06_007353 [Ceratobasidium sp. 370]